MTGKPTLFLLCGKMAAGKSTLAQMLADREHAMMLASDAWLGRLYPEEIVDVSAFLKYSSRLNDALTPFICALLERGMAVVLDFPGNTRQQRAWFRHLIDASGAGHELHVIEASDAVCKRQLRERSAGLPAGSRWTTDAEFDAVTMYFDPPSLDEGFTIIRHQRT
jgi:predicted kinase